MHGYFNTKGKELTYTERQLIERWHNKEKLSNRQIAQRLNKAPQTIHHELKRGQVQLKTKTKYSASHAQDCYRDNMSHCGRPSKLTSALNDRCQR
ncbi:IS30 family transposase [Lactovum miscens]|uniref:IS30 family transposase n=1 Tax=Lactovum miscens TaxID=190387 RepID=A0A841CA40_9LACT|nr:helix-turn-helix domain-containing protein [Lactovum miscens]MBB5888259.1 IS30 family transposase [Lactovum miscens]